MNLASTLAKNQLKRNRKRTLGAITAITMATALITAVLCFAISGIDMLTALLGKDFAEYGSSYTVIAFIPALILTGLIAFMAVSVISNIFQASANDRVKELGVLKCVGGTTKQIKMTVLSEGVWLSIIGIPAGLLLGTMLGFAGVNFAGMYIDRIAEITRSIVMRRFEPELHFSVRGYAYLIAAVFSFVTVLISALRPARQMSRITAVECVSFGKAHKEVVKKANGSAVWRRLWGFEGELGARNISRRKKFFGPAVRALSIGICLLLVTAGLASQVGDIRKFMKSKNNYMLIDYVSLRDENVNPVTGRDEETILHPISADVYNEIGDRLSAFGDLEVWGIGSNRDTYYAKADTAVFTDKMKLLEGVVSEYGDMDFDMVSVTEGLYRQICDATGTVYGGNILINTYTYNASGEVKEIVPFTEELRDFELVTAGGDTDRISVDGYLYREDLKEWPFDMVNRATIMLIVPGADARYFDWYCEPGDREEEFVKYARSVLDTYYPALSDDSYADQGYTVRISREDTMVMALNVMIVLVEVIMYGFVIMLALMGFAGFISTITAGIRERSREFAVLKSVGMTSKALQKMLYSESLFCVAKASLFGGCSGILIPWLINLSVRKALPVRYHIPFLVIVLSVVVIFAVVLFITHLEIRKMKKQSLIETIRMDSIR